MANRDRPNWPEAMDRDTAAAFCSLSANHFETHCPVAPFWIGRRKLWHRASIEAWLQREAGIGGTAEADEWETAAHG